MAILRMRINKGVEEVLLKEVERRKIANPHALPKTLGSRPAFEKAQKASLLLRRDGR